MKAAESGNDKSLPCDIGDHLAEELDEQNAIGNSDDELSKDIIDSPEIESQIESIDNTVHTETENVLSDAEILKSVVDSQNEPDELNLTSPELQLSEAEQQISEKLAEQQDLLSVNLEVAAKEPIAEFVSHKLINMEIKHIVEAALFASGSAMSVSRLYRIFDEEERPERSEIRAALTILQQDYADKAVQLVEVAGGFRFQVKADYASWIARLFEDRPPRYSRALLETLSIIAYRQPVTRGDIENIRGVSVSTQMIQTLQEREWVKVVGHKEVPGKPALFATTSEFLDYFNLKSLTDLPTLSEFTIPNEIPEQITESTSKEQQSQQEENQND